MRVSLPNLSLLAGWRRVWPLHCRLPRVNFFLWTIFRGISIFPPEVSAIPDLFHPSLGQRGSNWVNLGRLGSTWVNLGKFGSTWVNLGQLKDNSDRSNNILSLLWWSLCIQRRILFAKNLVPHLQRFWAALDVLIKILQLHYVTLQYHYYVDHNASLNISLKGMKIIMIWIYWRKIIMLLMMVVELSPHYMKLGGVKKW